MIDNEPNAIREDEPYPWWPCPNCLLSVHFRATVCWERGEWIEYEPDEHRYEQYDPPSGRPASVQANDVECVQCGHRFDIAKHYEWPIVNGESDA